MTYKHLLWVRHCGRPFNYKISWKIHFFLLLLFTFHILYSELDYELCESMDFTLNTLVLRHGCLAHRSSIDTVAVHVDSRGWLGAAHRLTQCMG